MGLSLLLPAVPILPEVLRSAWPASLSFYSNKRAAPAQSAPVLASDIFALTVVFEGIAIRWDFRREWSEHLEREGPVGQQHPEADFSDFILSCRLLFDMLYPSVPLLDCPAPGGATSPSSRMPGSVGATPPHSSVVGCWECASSPSCASVGPVGFALTGFHMLFVQEVVVPGAQCLSAQAKGKRVVVGSNSEWDSEDSFNPESDEMLVRRLTEEQIAEEETLMAADAALACRLASEEDGEAGVDGAEGLALASSSTAGAGTWSQSRSRPRRGHRGGSRLPPSRGRDRVGCPPSSGGGALGS